VKYGFDIIDGNRVPQLVINGDFTITNIHEGTVHVETGCLTVEGILQGTLDVQSNAKAIINGQQHGTVIVASNSSIEVNGEIQGTTTIARSATLVIGETGKVAGTLTNDGNVILRGIFGGAQSGNGKIQIEGNGYIKQPTIRDGIHYYEW